MAIYHFSAQVISRAQGKSAVASASYRSAEKLRDERIGETFDYSRKHKVDGAEIHAPDYAPEWALDREKLWNAVEQSEKRKDAQLAREINVALPVELTTKENKDLVRQFVQDNFVSQGMIADVAFHDLQGGNPHAHIMLTTREVTPDGFGKKNRDWNQRELLEQWRENWAKSANRALERAGMSERIDHRSLEAQGVDRLPQIHVGVHANAMAKRGLEAERHQLNEQIKVINLAKYRLEKEERELQQTLKERPETERSTLADKLKEARDSQQKQSQQEQAATAVRTYEDVQRDHSYYRKQFEKARDEYAAKANALQKLQRSFREVKEQIVRYNNSVEQMNNLQRKINQISPFNLLKRAERKRLQEELKRSQSWHNRAFPKGADELAKTQDFLKGEIEKGQLLVNRLDMFRRDHLDRFQQVDRELDGWKRSFDLDKAKDILDKFERGEKLKLPEAKCLKRNAEALKLNMESLAMKAAKSVIRIMDQDRER